MAKVKLGEGKRSYDFDDCNFMIYGEEVKELDEKHLRSYSMKHALFNGVLLVTEGELLINIKHASVLFSFEHPEFCYGLEHKKFFKKDMKMDTIVWVDRDDLPVGVFDLLTGPDRDKPVWTDEETKEDEIPKTEIEDSKFILVEEDIKTKMAKFSTKKGLDRWAEENYGIKLDRRETRSKMEEDFLIAFSKKEDDVNEIEEI